MKRMGVLGGMSPQATMDFETRVHAVSQRLISQDWNGGYPPMVVWYHRHLPVRVDEAGQPVSPVEVDPRLIDAAAQMATWVDFLVITCNTAHIGHQAIEAAAGCPLLSMIDVTVEEVTRRRWATVGVLGFNGASPLYLDPLHAAGIVCETIDTTMQARLNSAIQRVMEGAEGADDAEAARTAVATLQARGVDGIILGCTEIPLLLGDGFETDDFLNPAALLAEAAVRFALEGIPQAALR